MKKLSIVWTLLKETNTKIALIYLAFLDFVLGIFFLVPGFFSAAFSNNASNYIWAVVFLSISIVSVLAIISDSFIARFLATYTNHFIWTVTIVLFGFSFLISWGGSVAIAIWLMSLWVLIRMSTGK